MLTNWFFSFFAFFDREKTKVSIPGIKLFVREMLYAMELSWGDTLLLLVSAVCCSLSCAGCAAAHILIWLTVERRHVALFLPLSWVPWLQEEQLAKRSSFFVSWELVGPSFLPHLLQNKSPSQVALHCNLLPAGTAGNGWEQRRFHPTSPQESSLQGHFSCRQKFAPYSSQNECAQECYPKDLFSTDKAFFLLRTVWLYNVPSQKLFEKRFKLKIHYITLK